MSEVELIGLLDSLRNRKPIAARPFRAKPCEDCAVACGFYLDYSEALKLTTKDEQLALSRQWFCHQTPNLACRGNANNLQLFDEEKQNGGYADSNTP
jgi:hypothetical protein